MKPILFNTKMVQAILEGRKTVTRRICKELGNYNFKWGLDVEPYFKNCEWSYEIQTEVDDSRAYSLKQPYQVGDILYVREAYCPNYFDYNTGYENQHAYKADFDAVRGEIPEPRWKPSIHMPKKAARIFLKVTDVRVERLKDITPEQAKNEGVDLNSGTPFPKAIARDCHGAKEGLSMYQSKFVILWNSTLKKQNLDKYGWQANPWVWVIEFERTEMKC